MNKFLSLLIGAVLLLAVQAVRADTTVGAAGVVTPGASAASVATPTMKAKVKVKKAKKKPSKVAAQAVWVCPMGDYSGPKTADGKCPKCGMDLTEKK